MVGDALRGDPWMIQNGIRVLPQGSYHNNTNVRLDSDMDIRVEHPGLRIVPGPGVTADQAWQGVSATGRQIPDIAAELAGAARIVPQRAGEPVPAEVRRLLGHHQPPLPPGKDLLWTQDAGTGLVYPVLWPAGVAPPASGAGAASATGRRQESWQRERASARESLRTRRYAVFRDIVPAPQRSKLQGYLRDIRRRGFFPAMGDGQVELRCSIHNEPAVASLHHGLALLLSEVCGEPVKASYCFLASYEAGAVLQRHVDRAQCAYNLSLVFDMQDLVTGLEPDPWPIYLEVDGQPEAIRLQVGDGLTYSGTELWHWRDALPANQRATVCFFHFVPEGFTGSLD